MQGTSHDSAATSQPPTIIDRIAEFIERFVFLREKVLYGLIALWVLATYLHEEFEYTGYLFAYSAEPQSGKSRQLEVLDLLVFNSSGVLIDPSSAVLFRTARNGTQLLDEVDSWKNRDELRGILNAGFRNGSTVLRMEKDDEGHFQVTPFGAYCPRALAGIGRTILRGTTLDRTFMFEMVRQRKGERREPLKRKQKQQAAPLKRDIAKWAKENKGAVAALYDGYDFQYLDHFRDRTIDVVQPVAAIVELVYKDDPRLEEARQHLIEAVAIARKEDSFLDSDQNRLLLELARLAQHEDPLIGSASELAEKCTELPQKPGEYSVAGVLRKFGFETKSMRIDGQPPRYRYVLSRNKLEDIVARYIPTVVSHADDKEPR
jgi:hypothetical protein